MKANALKMHQLVDYDLDNLTCTFRWKDEGDEKWVEVDARMSAYLAAVIKNVNGRKKSLIKKRQSWKGFVFLYQPGSKEYTDSPFCIKEFTRTTKKGKKKTHFLICLLNEPFRKAIVSDVTGKVMDYERFLSRNYSRYIKVHLEAKSSYEVKPNVRFIKA